MQALDRAPTQHHYYHQHLQRHQGASNPPSTPPPPTAKAKRQQNCTGNHYTPRRADPDSRIETEDPARVGRENASEGLTQVGSLSRTYTYPHLVVERYTNWETNVGHIQEESSEHHSTASNSAPSLTAPYLEPIRTKREAVHPQAEQPIYMGLDPRKMEENDSEPYERLSTARQHERVGLKGSVVPSVAGVRRKPPPRLINKAITTNHNSS